MAKLALTQRVTTQDPPEYLEFVKEKMVYGLGNEVAKLLVDSEGKYITFCFTKNEVRHGFADSYYPSTDIIYQVEYAFAKEIEVSVPSYKYMADPNYMLPKQTVRSLLGKLGQAIKEWRW